MKIFISWSGDRSQAVAEALRDWLPLILHYAKPWLSKSDIQAGDRWSVEVSKELQESNFGIICITRDNIASPWILFESGALAKSLEDGKVIPLLLDLDFKEISGPLAQFQAKKVEKAGIREMISALNNFAPSPEPDTRISQIFDPLYTQFDEKIQEIPATAGEAKHFRSQDEILEELVSGVRNVEIRVREAMDEEIGPRGKYRRRMSPGMMMDLIKSVSDGPNDPTSMLVFFSLFKDDMPWIYEIAVEYYRAVSAKQNSRAREARRSLKRALEFTRRGPIFDMLGGDSRMLRHMLMEASEFISFGDTEFDDILGGSAGGEKSD